MRNALSLVANSACRTYRYGSFFLVYFTVSPKRVLSVSAEANNLRGVFGWEGDLYGGTVIITCFISRSCALDARQT